MTYENAGPPTQAEVEAISKEIMEEIPYWPDDVGGVLQRAAIMIARLERAWLSGKPPSAA